MPKSIKLVAGSARGASPAASSSSSHKRPVESAKKNLKHQSKRARLTISTQRHAKDAEKQLNDAKARGAELKWNNVFSDENIEKWQVSIKPSTTSMSDCYIDVLEKAGGRSVVFAPPATVTRSPKLHMFGISAFDPSKDGGEVKAAGVLKWTHGVDITSGNLSDDVKEKAPQLADDQKRFLVRLMTAVQAILDKLFDSFYKDPKSLIAATYRDEIFAISTRDVARELNVEEAVDEEGNDLSPQEVVVHDPKYADALREATRRTFMDKARVNFVHQRDDGGVGKKNPAVRMDKVLAAKSLDKVPDFRIWAQSPAFYKHDKNGQNTPVPSSLTPKTHAREVVPAMIEPRVVGVGKNATRVPLWDYAHVKIIDPNTGALYPTPKKPATQIIKQNSVVCVPLRFHISCTKKDGVSVRVDRASFLGVELLKAGTPDADKTYVSGASFAESINVDDMEADDNGEDEEEEESDDFTLPPGSPAPGGGMLMNGEGVDDQDDDTAQMQDTENGEEEEEEQESEDGSDAGDESE